MIITYFGKEFFKVQQVDLVIAFNPISKDSNYKKKIYKLIKNIADKNI